MAPPLCPLFQSDWHTVPARQNTMQSYSVSEPLPFELLAVGLEVEKTVQACSFSICTRTQPGLHHRMHLGSLLAASR